MLYASFFLLFGFLISGSTVYCSAGCVRQWREYTRWLQVPSRSRPQVHLCLPTLPGLAETDFDWSGLIELYSQKYVQPSFHADQIVTTARTLVGSQPDRLDRFLPPWIRGLLALNEARPLSAVWNITAGHVTDGPPTNGSTSVWKKFEIDFSNAPKISSRRKK